MRKFDYMVMGFIVGITTFLISIMRIVNLNWKAQMGLNTVIIDTLTGLAEAQSKTLDLIWQKP